MAKISRDLSAGNLHPRENIVLTSNIAAINSAVTINTDGCSAFSMYIAAGFSAWMTCEGTVDGVNWLAIPIRSVATGGALGVVTNASQGGFGLFFGICAGYSQVRARCSSYTSGASLVTLMAETALYAIEAMLKPSDLHVTATGASAAAVTLTIPAAPAGLFQHFTRIRIERHTTALLTAAATPVIITTTNLAGSRAFSIPADAAAQGVVYSETIEPAAPIKATAAATAVTIVAPTTTGVIWRLSADYYNAP